MTRTYERSDIEVEIKRIRDELHIRPTRRRYMLDTSTCIYRMKDRPSEVDHRFAGSL